MGILDWRIKQLEKKMKKLRKEQREWEKKFDPSFTESTKHEIAWVLAYIDTELHDTRKKLVKLKRKKACKADAQ